MGASGTSNISVPEPFTLSATNVPSHKPGLLFYGIDGAAVAPFQGGTLCVEPPLQRTSAQWSGGNPPPEDCSGSFAMDFKGYVHSGVDPRLVPGAQVNAQYWFRDPLDPFGSGLTEAAAFLICP
jgi:hypothetical protein